MLNNAISKVEGLKCYAITDTTLTLHIKILATYPVAAETLVAEFNNGYVNGTVVFTENGTGAVKISLEQLRFPLGANFSIKEFPVKYEGPMSEICKTENIGNILDGKNCQPNKTRCGDLSGRLKLGSNNVVIDNDISLTGRYGIFGRSLTIVGQNVLACATIKAKSATKIVVGVFRAVSPGIAGTIVLQQPAGHPETSTAVDINLMLVDARSEPLTGLSFAVYESASTSNTEGSCEGVGEIYNPLKKTSCDERKHSTCPIGDLSAKLGHLDIPLPKDGKPHTFYIDTNLPLSGGNSVVGRSLVILSNGIPLICAKIQEYQTMVAEAMLDSGIVGFTQGSLYEPVMVNVSLSGGYNGITVYENVSVDSSCQVDSLGKEVKLIEGKRWLTIFK